MYRYATSLISEDSSNMGLASRPMQINKILGGYQKPRPKEFWASLWIAINHSIGIHPLDTDDIGIHR